MYSNYYLNIRSSNTHLIFWKLLPPSQLKPRDLFWDGGSSNHFFMDDQTYNKMKKGLDFGPVWAYIHDQR